MIKFKTTTKLEEGNTYWVFLGSTKNPPTQFQLRDSARDLEIMFRGKIKFVVSAPIGLRNKKDIVEALAELEHKQWIAWSKNLAETEKLSSERLERWRQVWCVPYPELAETQKEQDRIWARKVLDILK